MKAVLLNMVLLHSGQTSYLLRHTAWLTLWPHTTTTITQKEIFEGSAKHHCSSHDKQIKCNESIRIHSVAVNNHNIQLVIVSFLSTYSKASLNNLQQCFLSKSVWTSPHIQIVHSRATGANQRLSYPSTITHRHQFTLLHLLLCLSPYKVWRCSEYNSYSSLRTIPEMRGHLWGHF